MKGKSGPRLRYPNKTGGYYQVEDADELSRAPVGGNEEYLGDAPETQVAQVVVDDPSKAQKN